MTMQKSEYEDRIEEYAIRVEALVMDDDVELTLAECVFEAADNSDLLQNVDTAFDVLKTSSTNPDEWEPYVRNESDYREVIQAMAFAVIKRDIWNKIDRRSVVDTSR